MNGMVCPHCNKVVNLLGYGGGKSAAADLGVPFFGAIPLDPAMVNAGDEGRLFISSHADSPSWKAVNAIME